ncbi:DUF4223 family protein [Salmonella enterica subsp. enterica]|nr:DUF4223 family protein [Salmonella enterica subsp. enterica]
MFKFVKLPLWQGSPRTLTACTGHIENKNNRS